MLNFQTDTIHVEILDEVILCEIEDGYTLHVQTLDYPIHVEILDGSIHFEIHCCLKYTHRTVHAEILDGFTSS